MAKPKSVYFPYFLSGQIGLYVKVFQVSTGNYLDYTDGTFKVAPLNPDTPLSEILTAPSIYYFTESRSVWDDGEYQLYAYKPVDTIFSVANLSILNDEEVSASVVESDLKRALGLMHENIYIDLPIYDSDNNLVSARVRIYSQASSVGTSSDIIGTYLITAGGDGPGKFTTWSQVKE